MFFAIMAISHYRSVAHFDKRAIINNFGGKNAIEILIKSVFYLEMLFPI